MEATIDKIIEGKRKKGKEVPMDPKEVIEAELSKFKELPSKTARFDLCKLDLLKHLKIMARLSLFQWQDILKCWFLNLS